MLSPNCVALVSWACLCNAVQGFGGSALYSRHRFDQKTRHETCLFAVSSGRIEIDVKETVIKELVGKGSYSVLALFAAKFGTREGFLSKRDASSTTYTIHMPLPPKTEKQRQNSNDLDDYIAVLNSLLRKYINYEKRHRDTKGESKIASVDILHRDNMDGPTTRHLNSIGLGKLSRKDGKSKGAFPIDLSIYIPFLHKYLFRHRGTKQGRVALLLLQDLSKRRNTFDFADSAREQKLSEGENKKTKGRGVISHEQVLPAKAIDKVMRIVKKVKSNKWLSTAADSVDGLPDLQLYLVSGGKNVLPQEPNLVNDDVESLSSCTAEINSIIKPYLYDELLPKVRKLTNSPSVEIGDVFIRTYGQTGNDKFDDEEVRYGLPAHYDITSFATCVTTLDSTASAGNSGLYTIPSKSGVSEHMALREFFPLKEGDGVVHTHDIMHGVDVDPEQNQSRASLITWFVDYEGKTKESSISDHPWLLKPVDGIGQFILDITGFHDSDQDSDNNNCPSIEMYMKSASVGHTFALNALGHMLDESRIPAQYHNEMDTIARDQSAGNPYLSNITESTSKTLSKAFWFEAAMRGSYSAQISLATDVMIDYSSADDLSELEQEDMVLQASTLYTLASVQGMDVSESLQRMMMVEGDRSHANGIAVPSEEFFDTPAVQTLLLTL